MRGPSRVWPNPLPLTCPGSAPGRDGMVHCCRDLRPGARTGGFPHAAILPARVELRWQALREAYVRRGLASKRSLRRARMQSAGRTLRGSRRPRLPDGCNARLQGSLRRREAVRGKNLPLTLTGSASGARVPARPGRRQLYSPAPGARLRSNSRFPSILRRRGSPASPVVLSFSPRRLPDRKDQASRLLPQWLQRQGAW